MVAAIAMVAGNAACGGSAGASADAFAVRGVTVRLRTDAPFASRPDLPGRVESTIDAALQYWGGSWTQLEGTALTLTGAEKVPCNGGTALGCYDGDIEVTTVDPGTGTFSCVEATVLVHEIGHAVLGDASHTDPRWMQMDEVAKALGDRPGYAAHGEVPCEIHVSVWRHPLGSP
ncbi:MAG: hypothetical protein QM767_01475 [Anaeromyxobacter sp.]